MDTKRLMEVKGDRDEKTDTLKDWMNEEMAAPSSTLYSNSTDSNPEQPSCLSSLESFLFLPQLPVNGDDSVDEDAHFSRHHYPHHYIQDAPRSSIKVSNPFSPNNSSLQHNSQSPSQNDSNSSSNHVCGGHSFPSNFSFSFIAAKGTVTDSSTPSNSTAKPEINNKSKPSPSPITIFVKGSPPNKRYNHNHSSFSFAANHQPSHVHRYPHQNHRHHCNRQRFLIFKICQVVVTLLCTVFLLNLVKNSIWDRDRLDTFPLPPSARENRLIQSWNMPSIISFSERNNIPEMLSNFASNNSNDDIKELLLLDVPNFKFLMNNKTKCNIPRDAANYSDGDGGGDGTNNEENNTAIFFMLIVHSAPSNFEAREAIRLTWGSLQRIGKFQIRLVFLLGQDLTVDYDGNDNGNNDIGGDEGGKQFRKEDRIQEESKQYGDIVAGNFHDSYRNLTYKHLMGYKWVMNYCNNAKFVLKADDDAFIDIFQLFKFVLRTFGDDPEAALICNVFPDGTKPVRKEDIYGKKWEVSYKEYPYKSYPKYCGGLAYLATPNVIREIYSVSGRMQDKYLWIDDVFVTGILRELAHVEPFYLNLRYSYDPEEYRKWLHSKDNKDKEISDVSGDIENKEGKIGVTTTATLPQLFTKKMKNERRRRPSPSQKKLPFMIVHLERGSQMGREMRELWNKTWDVWSKSDLVV